MKKEILVDTFETRPNQNVFSGPDALRDFLNPERNPPLPLVELPASLNPFLEEGVRIFAKAMYLSPLLNVKALAALNILSRAKAEGKLNGVHTIVENSSGNMAASYAFIAPYFGIRNIEAFTPRDIAPAKLAFLLISGVTPIVSNEAPGEPSGIEKARQKGTEPGYFNPGQYENEANPEAYEKWLAPEIWKQTEGKLTLLAAALGTTGTIVGCSRYFAQCGKKVDMLGVACLETEPVPGVRSLKRLREIRFDWETALDFAVEVGDSDSFKKSRELCRIGILAGPSSGLALAGLLKFLSVRQKARMLEPLRNSYGEVCAIFICPDSPLLYPDRYSARLFSDEMA